VRWIPADAVCLSELNGKDRARARARPLGGGELAAIVYPEKPGAGSGGSTGQHPGDVLENPPIPAFGRGGRISNPFE